MPDEPLTVAPPDIDYAFWLQLSFWRAKEAAALLLGLDPEDKSENGKNPQFVRVVCLIKRAQQVEVLEKPAAPIAILEWAKANNLPSNPGLNVARDGFRPLKNWRAKYFSMKRKRNAIQIQLDELQVKLDELQSSYQSAEKPLDARSRRTLLEIIAALNKLTKSQLPLDSPELKTKVAGELELLGMTRDKKTIGKWLSAASEAEDEAGR